MCLSILAAPRLLEGLRALFPTIKDRFCGYQHRVWRACDPYRQICRSWDGALVLELICSCCCLFLNRTDSGMVEIFLFHFLGGCIDSGMVHGFGLVVDCVDNYCHFQIMVNVMVVVSMAASMMQDVDMQVEVVNKVASKDKKQLQDGDGFIRVEKRQWRRSEKQSKENLKDMPTGSDGSKSQSTSVPPPSSTPMEPPVIEKEPAVEIGTHNGQTILVLWEDEDASDEDEDEVCMDTNGEMKEDDVSSMEPKVVSNCWAKPMHGSFMHQVLGRLKSLKGLLRGLRASYGSLSKRVAALKVELDAIQLS
ncbi:hypothetical protein L6452_40661 [Arctium lappa]|uniref:Uncharacterized protein n=1 Tax=Arctium lappa TaxID=4217 RepID=A0ACB8XND0_ARCLA|nr:hypothetical protein L6452_40661 [Arctium lappa]